MLTLKCEAMTKSEKEKVIWMLTYEQPMQIFKYYYEENRIELDYTFDNGCFRYSVCMFEYGEKIYILPFEGNNLLIYDTRLKCEYIKEVPDGCNHISSIQFVEELIYCFCRDSTNVFVYDINKDLFTNINYELDINHQENGMYCISTMRINNSIFWIVYETCVLAELDLQTNTINLKKLSGFIDKLQLACVYKNSIYAYGVKRKTLYKIEKNNMLDVIQFENIKDDRLPFYKMFGLEDGILLLPYYENKVLKVFGDNLDMIRILHTDNEKSEMLFYKCLQVSGFCIAVNYIEDFLYIYDSYTDGLERKYPKISNKSDLMNSTKDNVIQESKMIQLSDFLNYISG